MRNLGFWFWDVNSLLLGVICFHHHPSAVEAVKLILNHGDVLILWGAIVEVCMFFFAVAEIFHTRIIMISHLYKDSAYFHYWTYMNSEFILFLLPLLSLLSYFHPTFCLWTTRCGHWAKVLKCTTRVEWCTCDNERVRLLFLSLKCNLQIVPSSTFPHRLLEHEVCEAGYNLLLHFLQMYLTWHGLQMICTWLQEVWTTPS